MLSAINCMKSTIPEIKKIKNANPGQKNYSFFNKCPEIRKQEFKEAKFTLYYFYGWNNQSLKLSGNRLFFSICLKSNR